MLKRTTHQLGIKDEHLDDSGYQWFLAVENGELTATLFTDHEPTNVTEPTIYDFMENEDIEYPYDEYITMEVIRKYDSLGNLSEDDRIEIFCDILKGSSDVTRENLDAMGLRYGVDIADLYKDDTESQESADKAEIMKRSKALSHHLDCPIYIIENGFDDGHPDVFQIGMKGYEVVTKAVAINNRFDCDDEFDDVVDFVVAYVTYDCVEGMYNRMKDSDYFVREL